ncbi:hypothetical protein ABIB25_005345 [Nakamurella sp. UYEF19]
MTANSKPLTPASKYAAETAGLTSWRDALTLIRMGVAFFIPWPFMTRGLVASAQLRAQRAGERASRRQVRS